MANGTTTSTDQMAAFANSATNTASQLTGMLTNLLNQLSPLEGYWQGLGGSAFATTKATVQTELSKLNNALNGIAADISTAGTNYATADSEQQSTLNNVNSATTGITSSLTGA
jgi:WXG100 family type VII secretion target